MPVRSLTSSVMKWPDRPTVHEAVREWGHRLRATHGRVQRVGYFGSYARGDWGVGSDLDVVVLVDAADRPFAERSAAFDATDLPVPADVLVYTEDEWHALTGRQRDTLRRETVWIAPRA